MKKIHIISTILAFFLLNISCDNDGGDSATRSVSANGALPAINTVTGSAGIIDLVLIDDVVLNFTVDIAIGEPTSTEVKAYFIKASGEIYGPATIGSNLTSFPQEYTLTTTDLIGLFTELTDTSSFALGDVFRIYTAHTFANGLTFDILNAAAEPNYYASDFNQYPNASFGLNYPVSCPSDIGGNYTVVSSGFSTDGAPINNPLVNFSYDIVLTDDGGGNYTISDGVAGVYQDWYCAPYGYCFETEGNFTDICNNLSGSWTERFGCQIDLNGTVNIDGTLTIQWVNCFGDTITEAIYTPR